LRRSSARRFLLALVALVVLAAAVLGGVVLERTVLDGDNYSEISEHQHDRLIDACVAKDLDRAACTAWLADIVEVAEAESVDYTRLPIYTSAMLQAFDGLENVQGQNRWQGIVDSRMQRTCDDYNALPYRLYAAFRDI
jgi:hypothetical protein